MTTMTPEGVVQSLDGTEESIFIAGRRRPALSGRTLETVDPGNGRVLANIALGGAEDIDAAVRSSHIAQQHFGGFKNSGYGRDLGEEALLGNTQTKSVWVNLD